jgi:hypothetical protein
MWRSKGRLRVGETPGKACGGFLQSPPERIIDDQVRSGSQLLAVLPELSEWPGPVRPGVQVKIGRDPGQPLLASLQIRTNTSW